MSKRSYVPPIEIRVGQNSDYQDGVDRMTCKHPGCKRWRVDGKTKFCPDHGGNENRYRIDIRAHIDAMAEDRSA